MIGKVGFGSIAADWYRLLPADTVEKLKKSGA
jgi:purine-cytosine permease-like protein